MAVLYRLALIGILTLTLLHQALSVCQSCDIKKEDKDCKEPYNPKDENTACVRTNYKDAALKLCKKYDKGWKIVCKWGDTTVSCKGPCSSSAVLFSHDVAVSVVIFTTLMSIQRFLH